MPATITRDDSTERREQPKLMVIEQIPIAEIHVPDGRRALRDIAGLMQSIQEIGLQNPISVSPDRTLVAGLHRLESCRALGYEAIPAVVLTLDALRMELVEIEENLVRLDYDGIERMEAYKRQKEIYEALHPEAAHGAAGKANYADYLARKEAVSKDAESASLEIQAQNNDEMGGIRLPELPDGPLDPIEAIEATKRQKEIYEQLNPESAGATRTSQTATERAPAFAKYAAARTGRAVRTIQEDIRLATKISAEVRDKLRGTPLAQKHHVLTSLAMLTPEEQMAKAERMLAGLSTPAEEGLGIINRRAPGEGSRKSREQPARDGISLPEEPREAVRVLRRYFSADELRAMAFEILGSGEMERVLTAVQKQYGRLQVKHALGLKLQRVTALEPDEED